MIRPRIGKLASGIVNAVMCEILAIIGKYAFVGFGIGVHAARCVM